MFSISLGGKSDANKFNESLVSWPARPTTCGGDGGPTVVDNNRVSWQLSLVRLAGAALKFTDPSPPVTGQPSRIHLE